MAYGKRAKRFNVDIEALREKKNKLGLHWSHIADITGIQMWKIKKVMVLDYATDEEAADKLNEWIVSKEPSQTEIEAVKAQQKQRKKTNSEFMQESRARKERAIIEKEKAKEYLENKKYIKAFNGVKPIYSKGDFRRLKKGVDLQKLDNFYYRFARVLEFENNVIKVHKETYLRSVELTSLTRYLLSLYFENDVIEVFERLRDEKKVK